VYNMISMMFGSCNSNATGAASETSNPSGAHEFNPGL
jgi:hypothetical protein